MLNVSIDSYPPPMKLVGKEIFHPSHSQHKLKIGYTEAPFRCDGCKEAGIGLRYRCEACDFDLHKICALAPAAIAHPFYGECEFRLCSRPPGAMLRACDACRKVVVGLVYHCARCGFDLHPCCANLPSRLDDGQMNFSLCTKISGPCHCCGGKGLGWSYRSECKSYNLHVSCVKELLVESWQAMYLNEDKSKEVGGGGGGGGGGGMGTTRIPSLRGTMQNHHPNRGRGRGRVAGKVEKCCQIAGGAVRIIISAILGDPTAMIAAVVWGFISK